MNVIALVMRKIYWCMSTDWYGPKKESRDPIEYLILMRESVTAETHICGLDGWTDGMSKVSFNFGLGDEY